MVEETIYEEEQRCNHVYAQECHDTFVTEMGTSQVKLSFKVFTRHINCGFSEYLPDAPQIRMVQKLSLILSFQQQKCEENFKKSCYIDFVETPRTHEVEECNTNLTRDCESEGEEVCTEEHETGTIKCSNCLLQIVN